MLSKLQEPVTRVVSLPSGLRIVCMPTGSPVSHCGIMIAAGTRDEPGDKAGIAHFLEHMFFKGTRKRSTFQVISRMEQVGGELNAFTTKEETCIHASFLTPHFRRAAELISDVLYHSSFPEKELRLEKQIVLDEIRSYADNPVEQIFDDFECMVFRGQPLGTPILGTPESVARFTRNDLLRFIKANYSPDRMVFAYSGPMPEHEIIRTVQELFSEKLPGSGFHKRKPKSKPGKQIVVSRNSVQAHQIIGTTAYSMHEQKRFALFLLNNILGGPGMNAKLNISVREKHGLAYHIESAFTPFRDTGLFHIYFSTDRKNLDRAMTLVRREIQKMRQVPPGSRALRQYKQQLQGQLALAQENSLGVMLSHAKSILNYRKPVSMTEVFGAIERVTARDLLETAAEILDESRFSSLLYNPE